MIIQSQSFGFYGPENPPTDSYLYYQWFKNRLNVSVCFEFMEKPEGKQQENLTNTNLSVFTVIY